MEKPHSFAGRVVQKHGKRITNDYAQPDKFFADMGDFLHTLDGVPYSAIEELEKYDLNRELMMQIIRRMFKIMKAAKISVSEEIKRKREDDPFNGLEEDLAIKKKNTSAIKISGEESE